MMKNNEISVYIHIPFCERKCIYCAFVSYCLDEKKQDEYVEHLVKEINSFKTDKIVKTIYFGGGTPSILSEKNIRKIFDALHKNFTIKKNAEITIEVNPNSVTKEKFELYRHLGVNRVSVGVQSLNNWTLKKIGRLHNRKMAICAVKDACKIFDNVSADLILGLENEKNTHKFAKKLVKLGVKHISSYILEIHEGTPIFDSVKKGTFHLANDDKLAKLYAKLVTTLKKCGLWQYEVSNFAVKGFESQHNINYWIYGDYVGFGASAHSFLDGKRKQNANSLLDYYDNVVINDENTSKTAIEEKIFLGLRCFFGVSVKELKSLGYDIKKNANYLDFIAKGVLFEENGRFFLNDKYYLVSDFVINSLL